MIIGLVGLSSMISAVASHPPVYHPLTKLIAGFFVIIGILILFSLLQASIGSTKVFALRSVCHHLAHHFLRRLGLILDNMSGAPSHDNAAVYWTHFIAKRPTLFSWWRNHGRQWKPRILVDWKHIRRSDQKGWSSPHPFRYSYHSRSFPRIRSLEEMLSVRSLPMLEFCRWRTHWLIDFG